MKPIDSLQALVDTLGVALGLRWLADPPCQPLDLTERQGPVARRRNAPELSLLPVNARPWN